MFLFKVLLLTNFKHNSEDDFSPVPEEVRDSLAEFHNNILLHCGERLFKDPVCFILCRYEFLLMLNSHFTHRYTY